MTSRDLPPQTKESDCDPDAAWHWPETLSPPIVAGRPRPTLAGTAESWRNAAESAIPGLSVRWVDAAEVLAAWSYRRLDKREGVGPRHVRDNDTIDQTATLGALGFL